jgi:hypothetical protein
MNTPHLFHSVKGVLVAIVCGLSVTSCADLARTGTGPAYLIIQSVTGARGGTTAGTFASNLESDVITKGSAFSDVGQASIRAEMKNALSTTAPSPLNSITLNRYRVHYRRTDGQNQPGIDVPFDIEGATTATIQPGTGSAQVVGFDLVRLQAKLERPLRNLVGGGGLIVISTIAEVTFYGADQAGNDVSITGSIDVKFADFGDS